MKIKKIIKIIEKNSHEQLKKFLEKYKPEFLKISTIEGINLDNVIDKFADLIMKAKYFENSVKASSEFDIPLVIIDKEYYFKKILSESTAYDEETKQSILRSYMNAKGDLKNHIFNDVAKGKDLSEMLNENQAGRIYI